MDRKQQTIDTYNKHAKSYANKFKHIGARIKDIDEVFSLIKKTNPFVLEIGCAYGREAEEILKRTNNYLGIDISKSFIELAKEKVSHGNFEVADIETFSIPNGVDIVFAFASLLHVDISNLKIIFKNIKEKINHDGIVRLSLKYADSYQEILTEDEFGFRTYYLYSNKDIENLAKDFKILKLEIVELQGIQWLGIILKNI